MGKQRRKFETGFKQQIVREVESGLLSVSATSRKYQNSRSVIDRWRQSSVSAGNRFPRSGLVLRTDLSESSCGRDSPNTWRVDLRRIQDSLVADNDLKRVTNGIALSGSLLANELRNNVVDASEIAHRLNTSLGGNKAVNNRIVG